MAGRLKDEIGKTKAFDLIEQEVFLNLVRTTDALSHEMHEVFKDSGLSATQYNVLRILRGSGKDGLACQEIGSRMITRDPDLTRLLDRLQQRGLVARERSTADRRVVCTTITPSGLKLLAELDEPLANAHVKQLSHMSKAQLGQLIDLLELARENAV